MIPEKMLSEEFKRLAETKGDVSLMDGVMSDPSYLSELSQSLSPSTHITTAHVEVPPPPHHSTHTLLSPCTVCGQAIKSSVRDYLHQLSLMDSGSTGHAQ